MRQKAGDPQAIVDIFAHTEFDLMGWLSSLSPEALSEYLTSVEGSRNTASQIQGITDRVLAFKTIKDL